MRRVSRAFHACTLGVVIASGIAPVIGAWKEQQPQSTRQVGRGVADEFSSASIQNARVRTAGLVPAGSFTPPGSRAALESLPQFCRVQADASASADSLNNFEVWVPDMWNGNRYKSNGSTERRCKLRLPVTHESVT